MYLSNDIMKYLKSTTLDLCVDQQYNFQAINKAKYSKHRSESLCKKTLRFPKA